MGQIPQQHDAAAKDPAQLLTQIFRGFTGVFTSATRIAIPDDKVYNSENVIPIGEQNAHVVKNISAPLINYGSDNIYWSKSVNQNGLEYLVNFSTSGKVFLYDVLNKSSFQINAGLLLSGSASRCDQWSNTVIVFIDSSGYYSYDGANFTKISGSGVPSSGDDICVYADRVWIVQGRTMFLTGANDYTAASWLPSNGAAFAILTDPQIRSKVQRLVSANQILYLYGTSGVSIIANVFVPAGSVPPSPVFSITNIQPLIGTDQPLSLVALDRFTMFANRYGVYNLYGLNATKVSDDIDGTWQYLDFTQTISGGQVVIEGILCAAFLLKRLNDPIFGSNTIIALYFVKNNQPCWWFANFGAITLVVPSFVNNTASLFCFRDNSLYQLFSDATTAPNAVVQTKLWPMEDDLATKEVIRVGFVAQFKIFGSSINLTVDTQTQKLASGVTLTVFQGLWINPANQSGGWINSTGQEGGWTSPGPYLTSGSPAAGGIYDRYIGLTLTSVGFNYELNLMAIDYKLRDRWVV